jgi:hypothetical protein
MVNSTSAKVLFPSREQYWERQGSPECLMLLLQMVSPDCRPDTGQQGNNLSPWRCACCAAAPRLEHRFATFPAFFTSRKA